jgi:hypothetical protein
VQSNHGSAMACIALLPAARCAFPNRSKWVVQGPVVVRGMERYLELKQLAERQKREAEERAAQVFNVNPRAPAAGRTVPQPFKLAGLSRLEVGRCPAFLSLPGGSIGTGPSVGLSLSVLGELMPGSRCASKPTPAGHPQHMPIGPAFCCTVLPHTRQPPLDPNSSPFPARWPWCSKERRPSRARRCTVHWKSG